MNTLLCDDYLDRWKDNSFSHLPPDFLNDKDNLMIEVMRIDDHSFDGKYNPVLEKERHLSKELEPFKKMFPNANFFINAVTDLPTNEDYNYMNYYLSFQRTIRKHKSKITKYRKNHPDKKLIFKKFI